VAVSRPDPADTSYWDDPVEGECVRCGGLQDLDPDGLCSWCAMHEDDDYEPVPQTVTAVPLARYL
jgi:NMD protein affecting ribosome stability and mRNA decay